MCRGRPLEFPDGHAPDFNTVVEQPRLTDTRNDDDRRDGFTEQEVLVLGEKEDIGVSKSRADSDV